MKGTLFTEYISRRRIAAIKETSLRRKALFGSAAAVFLWQFMHVISQFRRAAVGLLPIPQDQTIYLQMFENMLHLRGTGGSIYGMETIFANHFSPVFFLLLPFYAALKLSFTVPHPILIFTFVFLLGGCILLLVYAEKSFADSKWMLFSLAFMLIGCTGLNNASSGGFRETFLAVIPAAWMIYSFEKNDRRSFVISSLILLGIREDYGIVLFGFSLVSFRKKDLFWKLYPVAGIFFFLFLMTVFMPHFHPLGTFTGAGRFSNLGNSFTEILLSPVQRPSVFFNTLVNRQNMQFLLDLIYPFCFLPLFAPRLLLPALPYLIMLLLNNYSLVPTSSVVTWYSVIFIPFLALSSAEALKKIEKIIKYRKAFAASALLLPLLFAFRESSLFSTLYFPDTSASYRESVKKAKSLIGEKNNISASFTMIPFFSDYENLKEYRCENPGASSYYVLDAVPDREAVWKNCRSYEEYSDIMKSVHMQHANRILYSDRNIVVLAPEKISPADRTEHTNSEIWEEAEFAGSEFFYNISVVKKEDATVRSLSGILPGLSGRRSAGNAVVGGMHSGTGKWELTVRMKGDIPESCAEKNLPGMIIRDMTNIYHEENFPRFHKKDYADIHFYFTMNGADPFFPVIRYRKCGSGWIDKFKLKKL